MAFERFGKEHLALTKVIEKYFGADAGHLDISCLDLARTIIEAGWTKPVPCKDCKHYGDYGRVWDCKKYGAMSLPDEDDFCSYGEMRSEDGK